VASDVLEAARLLVAFDLARASGSLAIEAATRRRPASNRFRELDSSVADMFHALVELATATFSLATDSLRSG
jgi:hypothetical protein